MNDELKSAISGLAAAGWVDADDRLGKKYAFKSFADAIAFMMRCAPEIERLDHHPEWFNVYNKVNVDLTTHSKGRVTMKDVELAKIMDKIAAMFPVKG